MHKESVTRVSMEIGFNLFVSFGKGFHCSSSLKLTRFKLHLIRKLQKSYKILEECRLQGVRKLAVNANVSGLMQMLAVNANVSS